MGSNTADRNRKQAAKAIKRKTAVAERQHAERFAASIAGRVAAAASCPLERCIRHEAIFETGFGTVVVARELPSGLVAAGFFQLNVWCLGAKDVVFKELSRSEFEDQMQDLAGAGRMVDIDPACARNLVAGAVAYAASSTFQPAKHYAVVQRLFGDTDVASCAETFIFGRDGLPTYFDRTEDPPGRSREIIATLERVHGADGWDVMTDLSLGSAFGRMKVLVDSMRDAQAPRALRAEIEAFDESRAPVIEHDPEEGREGLRGVPHPESTDPHPGES